MADIHKVILVGNFGVGKTSITKRFTDNTFSEGPITDVLDSVDVVVTQNGRAIKLKIGDTAGGEKFRTLTSGYFRNAEAVIVVYDVSDKDSFEDLNNCFQEAEYYAPASTKFLVANKIDLATRVITKEQGQQAAEGKTVPYFETSAKSGDGVTNLWNEVAKKLAGPDTSAPAPALSGSGKGKKEKSSGGGGGCQLI